MSLISRSSSLVTEVDILFIGRIDLVAVLPTYQYGGCSLARRWGTYLMTRMMRTDDTPCRKRFRRISPILRMLRLIGPLLSTGLMWLLLRLIIVLLGRSTLMLLVGFTMLVLLLVTSGDLRP